MEGLVLEEIEELRLVDHHVHGALAEPADRARFESFLTESDRPAAVGTSRFDSQLGFAVRRWCAPVLGLQPHTGAGPYCARRAELGTEEVNRRLLTASGIGRFLVDTGILGAPVLGPPAMAEASGARAGEIVRLESLAEGLAADGIGATAFARRFPELLAERSATAAGLKSIIAYRHGLAFDPEPPAGHEVVRAAGNWLRARDRGGTARLADPVLLRFLLWCGIERGLPLQLHTGLGDPDLRLRHCDPALLTDWLERIERNRVDVLLLHCYPFHRNAGFLAQVYPHVYLDTGLALTHLGARAEAVLAESLELAPFGKLLFSSDAFGPAELHHLGALLWRRAMRRVLGGFVTEGAWSRADALRVARMIGAENAQRVYTR
ncbi:amidohydrolase family protein [Sciscionella marina]|uniref:amidohydrolase family protein n=1 Tax=Sciscionella marina TaxID=508770 RepID=UPI00036AA768|nr:amidohydrolase family protein [Sciscionella marina]